MNKIFALSILLVMNNANADNHYKDYFKRATKLIIPEANAQAVQPASPVVAQPKYIVPELKTDANAVNHNTLMLNTPKNIKVSNNIILNNKTKRGLALSQKYINADDFAKAGADGVVRFKYGSGQPTLVCSPLNVCSIILERDEILTGHNLGDPTMWDFQTPQTGNNIIVIKPNTANVSTNVLIFTLKNNIARQYSIKLVSHPTKYMPFIAFTYSDEIQAKNDMYYAKVQAQLAKQNKENNNNAKYALSANNLDYSYQVTGTAPFNIERVYTDGIKTYIDLKNFNRGDELPIFMAQTSQKKELLTNHFFDSTKNRYIVDYKVTTGYLIAGDNKLKISYTGKK